MSRRSWLASAGAILVLTACGCLTVPTRSRPGRSNAGAVADLPPLPPPPKADKPANPEVTRAQKPEGRSSPENGNEISAVCHLLTLPVERPAEAAHAHSAAAIRAVVNGDLILEEEALLACRMTPQFAQRLMAARTHEESDAVIKQAVEELIEREIVLQDFFFRLKRGGKQGEAALKTIRQITEEAFDKNMLLPMMKNKHFANRKELAEYLRHTGMSMELVRRWWERNFMMRQYLNSRIDAQLSRIGHTEISEYYDSHRDEYTQIDSVDWQDIFLDAGRYASRAAARQFGEALIERARQGEDFAKLSHEFDNGESGKWRKSAGQGHKHGEIFPPEAEPVLFKMHDGDINIVECAHGFHIVRLVKRQYAGPISFDAKVQKEIHNKLREMVFMREKDSIIKRLKQKAVIDRCE